MSGEDFLLKWNDHHTLFFAGAEELCHNEEYTDVTLAAGARLFPAHRLVLSVCSPYFRQLFQRLGTDKPVIYLKDVEPRHMELLLNYMYKGEINVEEQELVTVLNTAQGLEIRGLTQTVKPKASKPPVKTETPRAPVPKTVTPTHTSNSQSVSKKRKIAPATKTPLSFNGPDAVTPAKDPIPSASNSVPDPIDIVKQEVSPDVEEWNSSQSDHQMPTYDNGSEYDGYEAEYYQDGLGHIGPDDSSGQTGGEPDDRVVSVTVLLDGQLVPQWQCAVCGKTSKWKPVIARHLVTHTGAKNFLCRFCNQAFGVASNKSRHEKRCEFRTY